VELLDNAPKKHVLYITTNTPYIVDIMSPRTRTRETQTHATATVLQEGGNYDQSSRKGTLLTLEELPKFLKTGIKDLENTEHYKENGYVWFYLSTKGTDKRGFHKFNPNAETVDEMFKPVSEKQYYDLPFAERAYFYGGNQPLSVYLDRGPDFDDRRVGVVGFNSPQVVAPVVVVKQQAGSEAAAHKPSAELVANARDAVAKLDGIAHPDVVQPLAELLRALE